MFPVKPSIVHILYSGLGGHSSVVFSLLEADAERNYNYVVIFYGIENMPAASVVKCKQLGVEFHLVKKKQGLDIQSQKDVIAILRKVSPAAIILHSVNLIVPVYSYAKANNSTIVAVEHQSNYLKSKREWIWSVLLMLLADNVVYLTDLYRDQMKARLKFAFRKRKVHVINNGINTDLFRPKSENVIKKDAGMLSRLSSIKDHTSLLKAWAILSKEHKLNGLRLFIAGDGESRLSLEKETDSLGIRGQVTFMGTISEPESADFLNSLKIYIHASLGETMSTSIMQAMACGKPVIASDVEGINNMIENGINGILVPPSDPHAISDAVLRLLDDEVLLNKLASNALDKARQNYSNKVMFDKYRRLLPS